jgi:hypothetical protein
VTTTFELDGFTLLPCRCGARDAYFRDEMVEWANADLAKGDPSHLRFTGLLCRKCGTGVGGDDDSPELRCGWVDGWNTSFMMGRDPIDGPFLPSADGKRSAEFMHLDMLDGHTTNAFGALMMFGCKRDQATEVLRYFKAKAALEDQLGFVRTGIPIDDEKREQRDAVIAGLEEFLRTGDFKTAMVSRLQKWAPRKQS